MLHKASALRKYISSVFTAEADVSTNQDYDSLQISAPSSNIWSHLEFDVYEIFQALDILNICIFPSPQLCCVCNFAALHTSQHRAYGVDRRAILVRCSNVNNDEKFRTQSLQQLLYWAVRMVLFKKNVNFTWKKNLKS